jgi:CubicO group peptidase (beta-lactamase class C family)
VLLTQEETSIRTLALHQIIEKWNLAVQIHHKKSNTSRSFFYKFFDRMPTINIAFILAILCCIWWSTSSSAKVVAERDQENLMAARVEAYTDAYMTKAMKKHKLVGVTVSITHKGRKLFSKGYGYEDIVTKQPVSASNTLFNIGSVTKLFTATATMQLYERGQLPLDQDVGKYLDFKFPRYSEKPITMAHLMTHTAGFEESYLGFVAKKSDIKPLGQMLKLTLPHVRLVREPGMASSYSNHGVALEGYVVERISGLSYPAYADANIFKPLGMSSSTVVEPLPPEWFRKLAKGYSYKDGKHILLPQDVVNFGPSGSIASTADDMAKFMLAHLGQDQATGKAILKPQTITLMHRCHFSDSPLDESCNAYGFQKEIIKGNQIIQHNGGTFNFLSNLVLVPGENFGVFVSVNSPEDGGMNGEFPKAIIENFFAKSPAQAPAKPTALTGAAADYEGYYAPMRRPYGGWLKISGVGAAKVSLIGNDKLKIEGSDVHWHQISKDVFQSKAKEAEGVTVVFKRDEKNNVIGASIGDGFDKVPFYLTQALALPLLGAFGIFALAFLALSVLSRKRIFAPAGGVQSIRRLLNGGLLFTLCGFAVIAVFSSDERLALGYSPPVGAHIMVWLFNVAAALFAFGAYRTFTQWTNAHWTLIGRITTVGYIIVAIGFCWFLWKWDLIGLSAWG